MPKTLPWRFLATLCLGLLFVGCSPEENSSTDPGAAVPTSRAGNYIVIFRDDALPTPLPTDGGQKSGRSLDRVATKSAKATEREQAYRNFFTEVLSEGVMERKSVAFDQVYTNAVGGFAAYLTEAEVARLRSDARVAYVEADQVVTLQDTKTEAQGLSVKAAVGDNVPYGIAAVGGAVTYTGTAWAWVIDSGIDLDHPDLNVATDWAATFAPGTSNADDQNGHGSHVAGTIAAKADGAGVVGVAAGAVVVPVRVFDASGSSTNSVIIAGIDYVTANAYAGDVANLSLGGGASTAVDDAVKRLAAAGVHVAIAAGNSARSAKNYSPARANGTRLWTVSAHDNTDTFARSFSNYGNPPIDVCAPGVSVYSTYKNGGYATLSGTSMAAPHVAGILLVNNGVVYSRGTVKRDRDRTADPLAAH